MDSFTKQYVETALWSSTDDNDDPLDKNYTLDDVDTELLKKMSSDCERFQELNQDAMDSLPDIDDSQFGHDFWLNRNGHGAGFWDGDYPEPQASQLDKSSISFGESDLYVGDDGKLHIY